MANKEKEQVNIPVESKLNADTIKSQIKDKMEYHKQLTDKKNELLGQLNKVETAIAECRGSIIAYQDLIKDEPSDNGEA